MLGERVGDVLAELTEDYKLAPPPIGVQNALNAAASMAMVEDLTNSDITEVRASQAAFAGVEFDDSGSPQVSRSLSRKAVGHCRCREGWCRRVLRRRIWRSGLNHCWRCRSPGASRRKGEGRHQRQAKAPIAFTAFRSWLRRAPVFAAKHRLMHWQAAFPGVWTSWESIDGPGGFDAVIGNPPYVRQEKIKEMKPALSALYGGVFDGMADLYVYFYDLGMRLLRSGGRLSFVVTNKWIKADYAAKLGTRLGQEAWLEVIVDFGHAKRFFPDADVMPCVIVAVRPPPNVDPPTEVLVAVIPRDLVDMSLLPEQVRRATFSLPRKNFSAAPWILEPPEVVALMTKIRAWGQPLQEYVGVGPRRGVLTGCNEAFVIDAGTRERLIREDRRCEEIIRPYLRGQDLDRWSSNWTGSVYDFRPARDRYRILSSDRKAPRFFSHFIGTQAR